MAQMAPTSSAPHVFGGSATSRAGAAAVVLGLLFGTVVAQREGGSIPDGNAWLGIVSGVVFAVLFMGVHRAAPRLPRELRATAWASFAGIAVGFLYSQGMPGPSVLRSTCMALGIAAGVFAVAFYRYYTSE
ncbi:hypothetical protein ACFQ0X_21535 [Streptomyces rectiviolaceus]|uniref:Integral membrane protein n=1 Tax=Streptomyces rectiviolaceus TaxID=332591 RepID=A0ABP6MWD7_9ACTN